jgi:FkbM family methyltransferase
MSSNVGDIVDFKATYKNLRDQHPNAPSQFEDVITAIYSSVLQQGDIAVDCGAHTGKHTLPMAKCVAPTGRVFAFEPIAEKLAVLDGKVAAAGLSGVVNSRNCVVGNEPGPVMFNYVQADPGKSSLRLRRDLTCDEKKMATNIQRRVDMVTLDNCLPQTGRCRFIKIDVEGAELLVLTGGARTIETHRPIIHFELGMISLQEYGTSPVDLWAFFEGKQYRIADVLGNVIETEKIFLTSEAASGLYDYIAVPNEIDVSLVAECASRIFQTEKISTP